MWLNDRHASAKREATWEETSEFYKDLNKNFTVSEFDREHRVEVYCKEQNCSNQVKGGDFQATNFLSQYFIQTHQGTC